MKGSTALKCIFLVGIEIFSVVYMSNIIIREKKPSPKKNIVVLKASKKKAKIIMNKKKNVKINHSKSSKFSKNEIYMLEKMVMAESEDEPYLGKIAVANVILNRVNSKLYPNTMRKVLFQRRQFSPIGDKRFFRVKPNKNCIKAVNEVLDGKKVVFNNVYYFVDKRNATDLYIPRHCRFVKRIGNHWFYKNKN